MLCYRQLVGTKKVLFNGLRSWQQNLQRIVKSTKSVVHLDQEKMKGVALTQASFIFSCSDTYQQKSVSIRLYACPFILIDVTSYPTG